MTALSSAELSLLEGERVHRSTCEEQCACEFVQFAGPQLNACWKREDTLNGEYLSGWCFADPARGVGPTQADSVATCPQIGGSAFLFLPLRDNWSGLITCVIEP